MMNCKTSHTQFSAFMDDELPEENRQFLIEHFSECHACRSAYESLQSAWDLLEILPEPEITPYAYTRLKTRMEQGTASRFLPRVTRILFPAMTMAMLCAGVILGGRAAQSQVHEDEMTLETLLPDYLGSLNTGSLSNAYSDVTFLSENDEGGRQ